MAYTVKIRYVVLTFIGRCRQLPCLRTSFALFAASLQSTHTSYCAATKLSVPHVRQFRTKAHAGDVLIICAGQTKLQFPTTCPSCDHSPLEADSCTPNKALRNTQRVWLQKRKKKEDEKAAAQAATPPLDATPAAPEVQPGSEAADKPVETVEEALKAEDFAAEEATGAAENSEDAGQRVGSTATQSNEVGLNPLSLLFHIEASVSGAQQCHHSGKEFASLRGMNMISVAVLVMMKCRILLAVPLLILCRRTRPLRSKWSAAAAPHPRP